ncbi:MAG TPA: hypothetical protein VFN10_01350 [Thermoanaerobaculia bacterium]|nr:hypothetical protein [Thermoanaerobaculia bacterium]
MKRTVLLICLVVLCAAAALRASDHADPMLLKEPYGNITGLFLFPHGDQMILVFNVRRALTKPQPYTLEPYEYVIHMDVHTPITFGAEDRARYGGGVPNADGISEDISFHLRLNNDTTLKSKSFTGLTNTDSIVIWTGVRDDPFIFPRFFKKNVISMVLSVPKSCFPADKHDFIVWGSVYRDGNQIDHVGRSNRSQLGRFGFLNQIPPNKHIPAIMKEMTSRDKLYAWLKKYKQTDPVAGLVQYVWQIRKYDVHPDVMIYSDRYPPVFPNGRQLADDIVGLTCAQGDCILQELAFVEGNWPRQTVNDKPFSAEFPFLAPPWPDSPEPAPQKSIWPLVITVLLVLLILFILFVWLIARIICRRSHRVPATA